jgi:hypothetical protein
MSIEIIKLSTFYGVNSPDGLVIAPFWNNTAAVGCLHWGNGK